MEPSGGALRGQVGPTIMELGPGPRYEDPVPLTDLTPRSGVPRARRAYLELRRSLPRVPEGD